MLTLFKNLQPAKPIRRLAMNEQGFSFDPMPKGFITPKPIRQDDYNQEYLETLDHQGQLIKVREHSGWKLIVVKNGKEVKIYTSGLIDVSDKLTHLTYDLRRFEIPSGTILVGKGFFDDNGSDNFPRASSCFAVNRKKYRDTQTETTNLKLVLNDVIIKANIPYCRITPCVSRLSYLEALVKLCGWRNSKRRTRAGWRPKIERSRFVFFPEELNCTLDEAKELVKVKNWTGLLIYKKDALSDFRLDGKSPRGIRGFYRWKPT